MNELLQAIRDEWDWAMPPPRSIVRTNKFGNVLVASEDDTVWRICPEEVSCERVAFDTDGVSALLSDPVFLEDWHMTSLVTQAEDSYGVQAVGRCFCLKIPGVLGGEYAIDNIGTNSLTEVVSFAGHIGRQIKDLPDGATIQFDMDA